MRVFILFPLIASNVLFHFCFRLLFPISFHLISTQFGPAASRQQVRIGAVHLPCVCYTCSTATIYAFILNEIIQLQFDMTCVIPVRATHSQQTRTAAAAAAKQKQAFEHKLRVAAGNGARRLFCKLVAGCGRCSRWFLTETFTASPFLFSWFANNKMKCYKLHL